MKGTERKLKISGKAAKGGNGGKRNARHRKESQGAEAKETGQEATGKARKEGGKIRRERT